MAYRTRKQITIAIIYFLIFGGLGAAIYYGFLKPVPTCSDNIKNQDEEGIDCGGSVCAPCYDFSNIEVIWAKTVSTETGFYDLAAKIKNPNPNDGLPLLQYHFQLKNSNGQVIGTKSGTTFILPNISKYVVETNVASAEPVTSVDLTFDKLTKDDWQKLKDYQSPDIYVKDKGFTISQTPSYLAQATGVVQNDTDFGFDRVSIDVILFDSNKNVVGISQTEVRTLLSGEGRYFSAKWFFPIPDGASLDMDAEVNLFLDENYMRAHGSGFQE